MNFEKIHHFELLDTNDTTNDPELLEQMSRLSLENIPKSVETSQDETQIHETLLMKNNSDNLEAKQKELDQCKKEGVYTEKPRARLHILTMHILTKNLSMAKR